MNYEEDTMSRHERWGSLCHFCEESWPCETVTLRDENAKRREQADALAAALGAVLQDAAKNHDPRCTDELVSGFVMDEADAALRTYREATQDETPRPCACAPGNICTCAFDCDCRERDTHIWTMAEGWRNIDGEQETRRDTEA